MGRLVASFRRARVFRIGLGWVKKGFLDWFRMGEGFYGDFEGVGIGKELL